MTSSTGNGKIKHCNKNNEGKLKVGDIYRAGEEEKEEKESKPICSISHRKKMASER